MQYQNNKGRRNLSFFIRCKKTTKVEKTKRICTKFEQTCGSREY